MSTVNQQNIAFITHKEIMQVWNISQLSAKNRLSLVRKSLGKKRFHKLTVPQYCQVEDISEEEFYKRLH